MIETTDTNESGGVMGIEQWYLKDLLTNYQTQLQDYVEAHNVQPEDVLDRYAIIPSRRPYFAAGLPYRRIAKLETFTEIPARYRHSLTIKFYHSAQSQALDNPAVSYTLNLPRLSNKRLSVTYEPATEADAQALENFWASGAESLPVYLFQVKPVIKLDDTVLATGTAIGMGEPQYYRFTIQHPHTSYSHNAQATAGDVIVFGVNGNGITKELVQKRLETVPSDTAEENMHQVGLHFWMERDWFDELAAQVYQVRRQRMPSVGAFSLPLSVRYFFGIPRSGLYQSRQVDVKHNIQVVIAATNEDRFNFMTQSGMHGSYLEGSVLDQLFGRQWQPAISATQILMDANEQNIPIYTITSENVNTILPILNVSAEVKSDIIHAVNSGQQAIVPEREIQHGNWTGSGYILQDLLTGSGAYLLEGGYNGGSWEGCEIEIKAKGHPFIRYPVNRLFKYFEQIQTELKAQMELAKKLPKGAKAEIQKIKDQWDTMSRLFVSAAMVLSTEFLISGDGCLIAKAKKAGLGDEFYVTKELYVALGPIEVKEVKVEFLAHAITPCWDYQWEFGDGDGTSSKKNPVYSYTEAGKYTVKITANCHGNDSALTDTLEVTVIRVKKLLASSDKLPISPRIGDGFLYHSFGWNPEEFPGGYLLPAIAPDAPSPQAPPQKRRSLNIFYKFIKDSSLNKPADFEIKLEAIIEPKLKVMKTWQTVDIEWSQISGPRSGKFGRSQTINKMPEHPTAWYKNPKEGGLYIFQFDLFINEQVINTTRAFVLLPLAGAEIDTWLVQEVDQMGTNFQLWRQDVENVMAKVCQNPNDNRCIDEDSLWVFWSYLVFSTDFFDYHGLAISADGRAPTRRYSYLDADLPQGHPNKNGHDFDEPSYVTLKGLVVYRAKVNNLLWAVFSRHYGLEIDALKNIGANLNSLFRGEGLDNQTSQNSIELGGEMFDAYTRLGTSASALTPERVNGMRSDNLNDFNLWPYHGKAVKNISFDFHGLKYSHLEKAQGYHYTITIDDAKFLLETLEGMFLE